MRSALFSFFTFVIPVLAGGPQFAQARYIEASEGWSRSMDFNHSSAAPKPTEPKLNKIEIALSGNFSVSATNAATPYGLQMQRGVLLALSERQEELAATGLEINIMQYQNDGSADQVNQMTKKVVRSTAVAVIGHMFSSEALLAAPTYHANDLLFVSPGASASRLEEYDKNFRTLSLSNRDQAELITKQMLRAGARSFSIVNVADCSYCTDLAKNVAVAATEKGLVLQEHRHVLSEATDFSTLVSELKQVDAVILPNYEMMNARIIKSFAQQKKSSPLFFGGDGWGQASAAFFRALEGETFSGSSLAYWSSDFQNAEARKFRLNYTQEFQQEPTDAAVLSYDAMNLVISAVLRAFAAEGVVTRESVLQNAKGDFQFPGALGMNSTSSNQIFTKRPAIHIQYENGKSKSEGLL